MGHTALVDFFGTPALAYGTLSEMLWKYQDQVFIFITNDDEAKGPGYVTMIGEECERDKIIMKAFEYRKRMHSEGHYMCAVGVFDGSALISKHAQSFVGGILL